MKRKLIMFVVALLLGGEVMYAQDFHFAPDFDYHDYTMLYSVIGQVYFNGEKQNSDQVEVACFVGDECRGRVMLMEPFPNVPDLGYFAYLPCYYNNVGETYTFKAYDHATSKEYEICEETVVGNEDGYGDVDNPYDLHFTREEEPTIGPEYPWIPSTAYSGDGMMVNAQIQINGQLVDRATYEVGAFCGEECRGNSLGDSGEEPLVDFTEDDLGYFAFMNIMGNDGDVINFYLYDLENGEIVRAECATTIELENDGELGVDIYGGDIFVLNFETEHYTKDIIGYGNGDGHYYLIASPIGEVSPENVDNMLANSYDLYYFDQSQDKEWINYNGDQELNHEGGFNLEPGKGYLYANSEDVTLTFYGTAYNSDGEVTLSKTDNTSADFVGWNLVGNPFAEDANIGTRAFYRMNEGGTEIEAATDAVIAAMEGIFVIAENDEETLTFVPGEPQSKSAALVMNISRNNRGGAIDRAIVRFGNESTLPKFMLNKDNTKLYIPQDNKDYAVANANEDGEMPVNFKASENGTYLFSVNAQEVDFSYLHLIDNLTGADVDLLATPSYSFDARVSDYASRFKLVFTTGNANGNNFAFYNNGNIIINNNGDATLQVVDVTGRIVKSENINGSANVSVNAAPGVYMINLINGNDVKTQKIVVE